MDGIPTLTLEGMQGLLFSLILSLDKRALLTQAQFITDLGEAVQSAKQKKLVSGQAVADLEAVHSWLDARYRLS